MRAIILLLATVLLSVTACWDSKDLTAAEREVAKFHKAFNAGQFEGLYDNGADELKKAASKQAFLTLLETVRGKVGRFVSAKRTAWQVEYSTGATKVVVDYETTYENGKVMEEFLYLIVAGKVLLAGYHTGTKNLPLR